MTSLHGAINGYQSVVLDHDEPPDSNGQGQPDGNVVYDHAEIGVEPHVSGPTPGELDRLVTGDPQVIVD